MPLYFKENINQIIDLGVDILFCNLEEISIGATDTKNLGDSCAAKENKLTILLSLRADGASVIIAMVNFIDQVRKLNVILWELGIYLLELFCMVTYMDIQWRDHWS